MVRLFRLCEAAARVVGRKNRQALRQPISTNVVRADGLEPAQRFRAEGFLTSYGFRRLAVGRSR
jgi:hypothetical protein